MRMNTGRKMGWNVAGRGESKKRMQACNGFDSLVLDDLKGCPLADGDTRYFEDIKTKNIKTGINPI
jgi:hypothetical protein